MATTTVNEKRGYRELRHQVMEKHALWIKENIQHGEHSLNREPSFPVGEYLGDLNVTDEMLAKLTNINPFVNSIGSVMRGAYLVYADFDYAGNGKFLGLRLEQLCNQLKEKE